MVATKNWSRDEVVLALGLYAITPASQINQKNKAIQELAELLGRTPGAVSFKLSNLLGLDKHRRGGQKVLAISVRPTERLCADTA